MADQKISELTLGTPLNTDVIPYVDLATNTTKKALKSDLKGDKGDTGATGSQGPTGNTGPTGPVGITWQGAYNGATAYVLRDAVSYNGSSYICILASTGNLPTNTTYWNLVALKGTDGVGSGDMLKATYDPTNKNGDAFSQDNMADGTTNKNYSATDKTKLAGISTGADVTETVIHAASAKTPAVDADEMALMDSAASFALKKITWANTKATLKTYFDTLYAVIGTYVPTTRSLTINGTALDLSADRTWTISASSFWTLMPGSPVRASNTTFTVTGDLTAYVAKGMIIKWTESGTVRNAMVSIPSTYGAPNTTITIVGDTMASIDASSLKYAMVGAEPLAARFAVAGTIGAVATNVANLWHANEPVRLLAADLQVGTAGTTNATTIDINIEGTTAFTTKPTLASTVAHSPTPFSADTAKSLALNEQLSIDVDAIQTTAAIDLYVQVYVWPTRYNALT